MSELKTDYDYHKEIKLLQAKNEAKQLTRKIRDYRSLLIKSMNEILQRRKITHKSTSKEIEELKTHMTKLNRQAFIFRKMLSELKQLRKTLIKRKNESV